MGADGGDHRDTFPPVEAIPGVWQVQRYEVDATGEPSGWTAGGDNIWNVLDSEGALGWELVTAAPVADGRWLFVLKRLAG